TGERSFLLETEFDPCLIQHVGHVNRQYHRSTPANVGNSFLQVRRQIAGLVPLGKVEPAGQLLPVRRGHYAADLRFEEDVVRVLGRQHHLLSADVIDRPGLAAGELREVVGPLEPRGADSPQRIERRWVQLGRQDEGAYVGGQTRRPSQRV